MDIEYQYNSEKEKRKVKFMATKNPWFVRDEKIWNKNYEGNVKKGCRGDYSALLGRRRAPSD